MAPFAAVEDLFGDFFDGEIGELVGVTAEGATEDKEASIATDFVGEPLELGAAKVLGGDVDEVLFGGVAMLPVDGVGGGVGEAFEFAEGFSEHAFRASKLSPKINRLSKILFSVT
jgi:hypothetical protein